MLVCSRTPQSKLGKQVFDFKTSKSLLLSVGRVWLAGFGGSCRKCFLKCIHATITICYQGSKATTGKRDLLLKNSRKNSFWPENARSLNRTNFISVFQGYKQKSPTCTLVQNNECRAENGNTYLGLKPWVSKAYARNDTKPNKWLIIRWHRKNERRLIIKRQNSMWEEAHSNLYCNC